MLKDQPSHPNSTRNSASSPLSHFVKDYNKKKKLNFSSIRIPIFRDQWLLQNFTVSQTIRISRNAIPDFQLTLEIFSREKIRSRFGGATKNSLTRPDWIRESPSFALRFLGAGGHVSRAGILQSSAVGVLQGSSSISVAASDLPFGHSRSFEKDKEMDGRGSSALQTLAIIYRTISLILI